MTLLRGNSVSYCRFLAVDKPAEILGKIGTFSDIEAGDDFTESFGACSWRNLLDGPLDAGSIYGGEFYALGLRMDRKKAPSQLLQATIARELSDLYTVCPAGPSKSAIKAVTDEVSLRLNREASPKPTSGMLVCDTRTGMYLLDGPSGAAAVLTDLSEFRPLYSDLPEYREFLAWMAWRGSVKGQRESETVFPMGVCTFKLPDNSSSASFDGEGIGKLLIHYLARGWNMTRCSFQWEVGGEVYAVTLDAACMKTALVFPEEVLKAYPPEGCENFVEWRLANRIQFILSFEESLFREIAEFLRRQADGSLDPAFLELSEEAEARAAAPIAVCQ